MRTNGTIRFGQASETATNEYGEIVKGTGDVTWGDPVPCSIKTNSDTRKGRYEDGIFRQASYQILVELTNERFTNVKLERLGEDLGEFEVLSSEPLDTVGRLQIIV